MLRNLLMGLCLVTAAAPPARAESVFEKYLPPSDQQMQRGEKHLTVGVPLVDPYNLPGHLQYRPSAWVLIGAGYDSSLMSSGQTELGDELTLDAHQHAATLYLEYYPLKLSGFHLGLGAEERFGTFTVHQRRADGKDLTAATGRYSGVYGGPSFGWTWLWDNGVTAGFDVSKRKRVRGQVSLEALTPDLPRDATSLAGAVQQQVTPDTVAGTFMLGYSF